MVSEDQKSEDQKKSWIAKLGSKWVQALIATLIGLSITVPLGFFWDEGTKRINTWSAEQQNMSYEDALAEAKENVGASTVDVIPFRNADSDQQYIAVITGPPKSKTSPPKNPYPPGSPEFTEFFKSEEFECAYTQALHQCYPIKILQKNEGAPTEVVDPGLAAYDRHFDDANIEFVNGERVGDLTPETDYRNSLLGVIDIDEDGNKEVYSMYRASPGAGTGAYWIKVKLYDSLTGEFYELSGEAEPTSTTVNPSFTDKRPKEEFSKWMYQQADTLVLFNKGSRVQDKEWEQLTEKERHNKEVLDWVRNNGTGFYEGQPKIEEHEGQVPEPGGSTACTIDEEGFEWHSYFKGALFSYDKSKDTHYALWVPESNYDWVEGMIAGKQYLWLDVIKDDGLLVFDKETQALTVIPVPELEGLQPGTIRKSRFRSLYVSGSSLYIQSFTFDRSLMQYVLTPLTLPDDISAEEEFGSAAGCSPTAFKPSNVVS